MKSAANRKLVQRWVLLGIGIAIFFFLIRQISLEQLTSSLARTQLDYLILGVLLTISATLIRTVRFGMLFPPRDRWMQLYAIFMTTRMLNVVMPMKSGEVAFVVMLRKFKFVPSVAEVTPVWLLLRTTDAAALVFLITVASFLFPSDLGIKEAGWAIAGLSIIAFVGLIGLARWSHLIPVSNKVPHLAGQMRRFQAGLIHTRRKGVWSRSLMLAILTSACLVLALTSFQFAFNVPFSPTVAFTVAVGVFTVAALPIHAPFGIGTADAAWTGAFLLMGLNIETAVAAAISIRLMDILVPATEGAIGACLLQLPGMRATESGPVLEAQARET